MSDRPSDAQTAEASDAQTAEASDAQTAEASGVEAVSAVEATTARSESCPDGREGDPDMSDLFDQLEELEDTVDSDEEREQVREAMQAVKEADSSGVFGRVTFGFDRSDAAEALLGSLLFGIPMFVEGGTQEVGEFVASHPVYLVATNALAIGLVIAILYVADFQDVRVHNPLFGVVPRKLLGVVSTAALTAVFMMTAWGRVDWSQPWLAVCTISVAFVPMAIGAALGDLLPG